MTAMNERDADRLELLDRIADRVPELDLAQQSDRFRLGKLDIAAASGDTQSEMISTVAVGTDGSPTAAEAVRVAAEMAQRFGSELVLLSAFQESVPPSEPDEVQWAWSSSARTREILARAEEDLKRDGIMCKLLVDQGDPAEVLVRLATECGADVLVIGNKGMGRRMLGSVPNTVSHKAPCSVFVVKTS